MRKWLLIKAGNIEAGVMSDGEPSPETGYDTAGMVVVEVDEFKPFDRFTYDGGWVERLADQKAQAIARVNEIREQRQLQFLTPGSAKTFVYFQKAQEIQQQGGPMSVAQAELTGQSLEEVLAEFQEGYTASAVGIAAIEAQSRAAVLAIKACETIDDIEQALNQYESLD